MTEEDHNELMGMETFFDGDNNLDLQKVREVTDLYTQDEIIESTDIALELLGDSGQIAFTPSTGKVEKKPHIVIGTGNLAGKTQLTIAMCAILQAQDNIIVEVRDVQAESLRELMAEQDEENRFMDMLTHYELHPPYKMSHYTTRDKMGGNSAFYEGVVNKGKRRRY
jgi:hypothetical protein